MNYDTWKQHTPDDDERSECHRRLKDYIQGTYDFDRSETKRAIEDIVIQLYGKSPLDLDVLDSRLSWLATEFRISIPEHQPTIESIYR